MRFPSRGPHLSLPQPPSSWTTAATACRSSPGPVTLAGSGTTAVPSMAQGPGMPLLGEHAHALFTRPHLRGYRLDEEGGAGRAWTTYFRTEALDTTAGRLRLTASDRERGARVGARRGVVAGRLASSPLDADEPRLDEVRRRGPRGGPSRARPPERGSRLHRPARARANPAAPSGDRWAVAARGTRGTARSRRGHHVGGGNPGVLHDRRRGDGRPRGLERQQRPASRAEPGHRHDDRRRRAAAARGGSARGAGELRDALGLLRFGRRRARRTRRRPGTPGSDPSRRIRRPSRWCSTCGRRSTSTTISSG